MLAPSEKHLEDWIVANFKAFGDLHETSGEYYGDDCYYPDDNHVLFGFGDRIIARQYKLPNGIADLILADTMQISLVELKKGMITYDVIGQCMRYIYDLRIAFEHTMWDAFSSSNEDKSSYIYYSPHQSFEQHEFPNNEIIGIVVGNSIIDSNLTLIAAACGIVVSLYEYDGQGYTFTREALEAKGSYDDYESMINGQIGMAARGLMKTRSERQYRMINKS